MTEKTDVLMATYNSEKYLEECLESVFQSIPVNRLIVADHNSTDGTSRILKKYDALVLPEEKGLGYARQLTIDNSETAIITFVDSDIVFKNPSWWREAYALLKSDAKIGAVRSEITEVRLDTPRMKYLRFWKEAPFFAEIPWFTLESTLFKRDLIKDIRIPLLLDAKEDRYLELNLLSKGYLIKYLTTPGIHYYDHNAGKGFWQGANTRLLSRFMKHPEEMSIFQLVGRRLIMEILRGIPPAFYYRDPEVIVWNLKERWNFLRGWLYPYKYRKYTRKAKKQTAN